MADLVTRLLLNTQQFDNNLGKSTKQIQGFQKNVQSFSAGAISAFTKFSGAIGITLGAIDILQKGLNANAALQEKFNSYVEAGSTVIDQFFSSIYNGDWTAFNDGILEAIGNAQKFAQQYTNIMKMLQVTSARYERVDAEKNRLESIIEDENRSLSERKKAQTELDKILMMGIADIREDAQNVEKYLTEKLANMGITGNIDNAQRLIEDLYDPTSALRSRVDTYRDIRYKKNQVINPNAFKYTGDEWYKINTEATAKYYQNYTESERKYYDSLIRVRDALTDGENGLYTKLAELFDRRSDLLDKAGTWEKDRTGAKNEIIDAETTKAVVKKSVKEGTKEAVKEVKFEPINVPIRLLTEEDLDYGINKMVRDDIESGKIKVSPIDTDSIKNNYDYADSLNTIATVMGSITNLTNEGAAGWIAYGTNIISAISSALPMITSLTTALTAKAAAEAAGSAASVPVVGWINAIAAISTIVAAMASVPKFATGGIVDGSSFYGDKVLARVNSGEMILNRSQQRNLFNLINGGGTSNTVKFRIEGKELVGVLNAYGSKTSKYK